MPHRLFLGAAFMAAALGGAYPATAATTANASDGMPAASAVARFYEARQQPLWLRSPDAIRTLIDALRTAEVDGLAQGPELAATIERVLGEAQYGIPGADREAERLMSNAYVLHAQALKWPGRATMIYADPSLSPRVPTPAEVLEAAAAAPDLADHVRQTVAVNPIHAALREAAVRDMRLLGTPPRALKASLERSRLLPSEGRFVLVDVASQQLMMIEGGQVVDRMKVVVGKPTMKTPLLAGTLRQVTFNPYWNVPVDLAATNIAQNVLKNGLGWFNARNYEVLSGWDAAATVIDPASVDWKAVAAGTVEARVRQRPGRGNSMGDMKFEFPNDKGIYLHDTPDRQLFSEAERTFSSGCVRLEDAARLGRWLLGREPVAASARPELNVALPTPVPVYLTYLTVRPEADGTLAYAPDVYGLDTGGDALLAAAN
ncbi:murein L,D-transpeptidase YcbB/YkuD [Sphingomonas kaistensis]|uniref:Murein L,D-transpeptidase YcbB/YkuD n=1 Tax=Sphingomonas kaistensis TaxID=298708 RepID=A0A7X5Y3Z6_9SPHN|nr:murein L,D-transpeptidase YcbB/YkuD [Sphingomonas kaistensis]